MAKEIELRRHTDNDGDLLTPDGVRTAVEIGKGLRGGYALVAASPARRAVQTAACLLSGLGEVVAGGVIIEPGLRSEREDEWRAAYSSTGKGDLDSLRTADSDLVAEDSAVLADGLQRLLSRVRDGERILAIGHSPTSEAAVYGLTHQIVSPLGKGEGIVVAADGGRYSVSERL